MATGILKVFSGFVKRFFGFSFIFGGAVFLFNLLLKAYFQALYFGLHIVLHETGLFQFLGEDRILAF